MSEAFVRQQGEAVVLAVCVQPRASRSEVAGSLGAELKVRIAAPPVDNAANEELVRFLARELGCPRGRLAVVRGHSSRHKVLSIQAAQAEAVQAKLLASRGI